MLRLEIVKTAVEKSIHQHNGNIGHGAAATRHLIDPLIDTYRNVCDHSYFASIHTARILSNVGMRFIEVVKDAFRVFLMKHQ